tara:strand:+ start:293 stop:808 length:516 start_codon:yes stop_codon:yes gene_type:complete
MPVANYLKVKQKNIQSKYHLVAKRFEKKYESIHRKLKSRFHRETIETDFIPSKVNSLVTQSAKSIENKIFLKRSMHVYSKTSTKKTNIFYADIYDWFQGRFSGQVIRIVVREGKIIEKVFLTPNGNRILIKRSKLILRLSSLPIIKIKISLIFRPIENITIKWSQIPFKSL